MQPIKPPRLRKGDLISLVSPASTPAPAEKIEGSVRYLEGLGYQVEVGQHAAAEHGYLAGTDSQRAEDLNRAIRDPRVNAVFALRGGYGTPRLLPSIDYNALRRQPKIISGFSDITGLQLAIYRKTRLVTFSGPMPAVDFWQKPDPFTEEIFWRMLTSRAAIGALKQPAGETLRADGGNGTGLVRGKIARGPILGGNLALLCSSLGTPFVPAFRGAILVLEEVDEYPYRVDRFLAQLRNAGILDRIAALVLGQFTRCDRQDPRKPSLTVEQVLLDYSQRTAAPVLANLQYGHIPRKVTLPLGLDGEVDAGKRTIRIPSAAVI